MTAPDMFALGGRQDDAELLALFPRWIDLKRAQDLIGLSTPEVDLQDIPEWVAGEEVIDELEQTICDIPAEGAIGLAIKAYMAVFYANGASNKDAAALTQRAALGDCEVTLLRDAARFVPAIEPLLRLALEESEEGQEA
jgi:hypothetical protein